MSRNVFLRVAASVLAAALLWGAVAVHGERRSSGLAAAADRASEAYAECLEGRIWRDFHICVPAAMELLELARAQSIDGKASRERRIDAVVRVQSSSEYLGRILALCDLMGHDDACVAVEPVRRRYGGAASAGESSSRMPARFGI